MVDQGAQSAPFRIIGDVLHECGDLGLVGDVEHDRLEVRGPERIGVCASTHADEDVEAAPGKLAGSGGADASLSTGHHEDLTTKRLCLT
jgi:hypothetical protein